MDSLIEEGVKFHFQFIDIDLLIDRVFERLKCQMIPLDPVEASSLITQITSCVKIVFESLRHLHLDEITNKEVESLKLAGQAISALLYQFPETMTEENGELLTLFKLIFDFVLEGITSPVEGAKKYRIVKSFICKLRCERSSRIIFRCAVRVLNFLFEKLQDIYLYNNSKVFDLSLMESIFRVFQIIEFIVVNSNPKNWMKSSEFEICQKIAGQAKMSIPLGHVIMFSARISVLAKFFKAPETMENSKFQPLPL